jgi:phosphatidylglycerophosphatase A
MQSRFSPWDTGHDEAVSPSARPRGASARNLADRALEALGSVLYLGYVPAVSGTIGSVPGVLVAWACRDRPAVLATLTVVLFVLGTAAARRIERKIGRPDPSCVVIDEMVGMMAALALLQWSWMNALGAFVAFRFFDISKPFPARQLEQKRGGLAIMLDDIVAAGYTWVAVRLAIVLSAQ